MHDSEQQMYMYRKDSIERKKLEYVQGHIFVHTCRHHMDPLSKHGAEITFTRIAFLLRVSSMEECKPSPI